MRSLLNRLLYLLRRTRHDADLREEMETHRSLRQEKLERDGPAPPDAASASRRALGNVTLAREDAREVWLVPAIESVWQDVRYAVRSLAKRPLPTVTAILTLALALGANVAIFSLIDRVLLRPLDVPSPEALVTAQGTFEAQGVVTRRTSMNWFYAGRVRDMTTLSDAAIASTGRDRASQRLRVKLPDHADPIGSVQGRFVTANYFRILGLQPTAGRDFNEKDDEPAAPAVVVLSHGFWQRYFGGDAAAIGQTIDINDSAAIVIGVAPRAFAGTDLTETPPDVYLPALTASRLATKTGMYTDGLNRSSNQPGGVAQSPVSPLSDFVVIGRVAPAEVGRAQAELSALNDSGQLIRYLAGTSNWEIVPLVETMLPFESRSELRQFLGLLGGAVGLTLLIGCANLTGLLLARTEERRAELAIRAALGAGRARLVRATAIQAALLATAGGTAAMVVAYGIDRSLSVFMLPGNVAVSGLRDSGDLRVLVVAMMLTTAAAIVIGLAPSARVAERQLSLDMKGHRRLLPRLGVTPVLVAVQVAVCVVFVFSSGLFIRSLSNGLATDLGFDRSDLIAAAVSVPRGRLFDVATADALVARARQVPGVASATIGPLPLVRANDVTWRELDVDGVPVELPAPLDVVYASADYFTTLRQAIGRGRDFDARDRAGQQPVVIVNEAAARRFWPDEDPLGRRVGFPPPAAMRARGAATPEFVVAGVVRDAKLRSLRETGQPVMYLPRAQHEAFLAGVAAGAGSAYLIVRASGDPDRLAQALGPAVEDVGLSVQSVTRLDRTIYDLLMPQRLGRGLLVMLGAVALALTVAGVYGLVSCIVVRSTKEVGIRLALGAGSREIVQTLAAKALVPVTAGVVVGATVAWFGGRLVDRFMYGIPGSDPTTLVIAVAAIVATSVAAALLPTRRALRINPVETLRAD